MLNDFIVTMCNRIVPDNSKVKSAAGAILSVHGGAVSTIGADIEGLSKHGGVTGAAKVGDEWWFVLQTGTANSLLVMDAELKSGRIEALSVVRDGHGLMTWEDGALIVSTGTNQVIQLDKNRREVGAYGKNDDIPSDTLHINDLCVFEGRVVGCKFGPQRLNGKRNGCVYDVLTGEPLFEGLDAPHSLTSGPDGLYVAESGTGSVYQFRHGLGWKLSQRILGYGRGLYVDDDCMMVGRSKLRTRGRTSGQTHLQLTTSDPRAGRDFGRTGVFTIDRPTAEHTFLDLTEYGPEVYAIVPA